MKNKVAVINAYITTDKIIQNNHFPDQGRYHNVYGIDLYSSCDKVQYSVAVMDARTVNRYGAYDARPGLRHSLKVTSYSMAKK